MGQIRLFQTICRSDVRMLSSELYDLVNEMFDFIGNPRHCHNDPHLLTVNTGVTLLDVDYDLPHHALKIYQLEH